LQARRSRQGEREHLARPCASWLDAESVEEHIDARTPRAPGARRRRRHGDRGVHAFGHERRRSRTADRLEAARWLADRAFGKPSQDVELALKAQEAVDVHAFAAFAATYLPTEMLDELILSVERKMEAERALPQAHSQQGQS
jgi:hypothetical protein